MSRVRAYLSGRINLNILISEQSVDVKTYNTYSQTHLFDHIGTLQILILSVSEKRSANIGI